MSNFLRRSKRIRLQSVPRPSILRALLTASPVLSSIILYILTYILTYMLTYVGNVAPVYLRQLTGPVYIIYVINSFLYGGFVIEVYIRS